MNSMGTDDLHGSSTPSSLIIIHRRHYKTKAAGANTLDAHDFGASNGKTSFKRLRKGDQPLPFAYNNRHPKNPLVNKALKFVTVPDAVCGKICQVARRNKPLVNKGYTFKEASSCCPVGEFAPAFDGNRKSTNSGSGNKVLGMENFLTTFLLVVQVLSPTWVMLKFHWEEKPLRGNAFSSTVFVDDNLTSKDNASPAREKPTCDNGEKVIQPPFPTESLLDCNLFSACGLMGSGSTNPCPENENVRFLKSATQLKNAQKQLALGGGGDSNNTKLSAALRVLTEELAGVRQELADTKSRVLQLQLSLEEIRDVLPDSWEY
ncbi:hypothetical protein MKW92_008253 [Papaver armeniacum]|nr:hypothetical protein MKW92_008253 [Papaver armeniacum]